MKLAVDKLPPIQKCMKPLTLTARVYIIKRAKSYVKRSNLDSVFDSVSLFLLFFTSLRLTWPLSPRPSGMVNDSNVPIEN